MPDWMTLRGLSWGAATVAMGLMAGAFALYAHTIMPGLSRADDRTFVAGFQALDTAIMNPWFIGLSFLGALAGSALAAFAGRGEDALPWLAAALGLYLIAFGVTLVVHVPLNNALKAAGDVTDPARLAELRRAFHEGRWVAWNLVRVVTTLAALVCLLVARPRT